ncbi:MAG: EAL domain-containing protein [Flexilinea sp.]
MKKYSTKLLWIIIIPFVLMLSFSLLTFASIPRTIKVGYFLLENFQELDNQGVYSGYSYDYLQKLTQYTGWEYDFVNCDIGTCRDMLTSGEIDLLNYVGKNSETDSLYDFSNQPTGTEYDILSVLKENKDIRFSDYESFNGMKIGLVSGNRQNDEFDKFCQERNLQIVIKEYSRDEIYSALLNGDVDGIVTSSMMHYPNTRVIARFSLKPYFAAVREGNDDLLSELNTAMNTLQIDEPVFAVWLFEKYFSSGDRDILSLTQEELDYLQQKRTLRVTASPDKAPISFFENGIYEGIVADILKKAATDLGITIEPVEARSYTEALNKVNNGEADVIGDFQSDIGLADQNGIVLTSPYMENQVLAVVRKDDPDTEKNTIRIAEPYGFSFAAGFLESAYRETEITYYETDEDCIKAVSDGRQDVSFLNNYVVQSILTDYKYHNLAVDPEKGFTLELSLGVNRKADPLLGKILSKEINAISSFQRSMIIGQNTIFRDRKISLIDIIVAYPVLILLLVFVFPAIVVFFSAQWMNSRQKDRRHMFNLAYMDEMTGLNNLHWMEQNAGRIIGENKQRKFAFVSLDIDRFDIINEYYGRKTGDMIIRSLAEHIQLADLPGIVCSRVKADHFLCLFPYETRENLENQIIYLRKCNNTYTDNETVIKLGLNIGVCLIPENTTEVTASIDIAETARREARNIPSGIVFFDDYLKDKLMINKGIEDSQEQALQNNEFEVYYQPKFNMVENIVIGAEALVRWNDPEYGFRVPSDFIPIFEKNGFIVQIDFFVLEEVCRFLHTRLDAGERVVPISVNQSRVHLSEKHYIDHLGELVKKYQIPEGLIELELTETTLSEVKNVEVVLEQAKALNYKISIDDFGTGYSSLTMLNRVPLDTLKIDRGFLSESNNSLRAREIIRLVVEMAHALDIQVVCEGVEKQDQADFLMNIGCKYGQGFLFSRPVPMFEFAMIL